MEMPAEFLLGIKDLKKRTHLFYWISNADSVSVAVINGTDFFTRPINIMGLISESSLQSDS